MYGSLWSDSNKRVYVKYMNDKVLPTQLAKLQKCDITKCFAMSET